MSEYINNREYRQKVLKELISELHAGKGAEDIKPRFEKLIQGISPSEISEMEQGLIMEGMPVEEIQRLCDVHAAVFKGSIEEIHRPRKPEETPGHPVHTFKLENRAVERLIKDKIEPHLGAFRTNGAPEGLAGLSEAFGLLWEIDRHYLRKENLLFPFMEKYGITAPPKVMWGVDDEIRALIKEARKLIAGYDGDRKRLSDKIDEALTRVSEMIFKEENILFPMVLDTLAEDEWQKIAAESDELGYCLVKPGGGWKPANLDVEARERERGEQPAGSGYVKFGTGILSPGEISAIFNTLPVDISFVDRDGVVKYFSQAKDRIFPRTKAVIGRQVRNCHPPASVHVVEKVIEDLKSGKKDHEDFWIDMRGRYVYIRYFAVRDENEEFLGVLEVTQDIKPIREISGEKRLASD